MVTVGLVFMEDTDGLMAKKAVGGVLVGWGCVYLVLVSMYAAYGLWSCWPHAGEGSRSAVGSIDLAGSAKEQRPSSK